MTRTVTHILVDTITGEPVSVGDIVTDFRGDEAVILGGTPPHKPSSTGRVYVRSTEGDWSGEYFPSVYNLKWENYDV